MPMFYYQAINAAGQVVQGSLEAREERLVVQQLHQGELIPLKITQEEPATSWHSSWTLRYRRQMSLDEMAQFSQELAVLLKARLPLDRSLQIIIATTAKSTVKSVAGQILRDLQSGKALSEALGRHPVFPPLYLSLVQAGEAGGFLDVSLVRLAEYLQGVREFRSHLFTALIYPIILAGVGGLSLIFMLLYVVPRFEVFFKEMGQTLFWSTEVLLNFSYLFRSYWWVGLILGLGLVAGFWQFRRSQRGRLLIDRFKMLAPFIGGLNQRIAAAFFSKTLGTLLLNGVPLVGALQISTTSVTNRYMGQILAGTVDEVRKGQPLSKLLKKINLLPEILLQMMAVGEETGRLAEMLSEAAASLENEVKIEVRQMLALMEPMLILTMGLLVAFIIISLLMPILNLYEFSF
jgi:general secretion pathway protein F